MILDFFLQRMKKEGSEEALVTASGSISYAELIDSYYNTLFWLKINNIQAGHVVSFDGDYSQIGRAHV